MQARALAAVLVLVAPLAAGCLGAAPDAPGATAPGDRLPVGRPSVAELDARTVEAPPLHYVGQWWQYRFDHEATGISRQVTLVVAGAEGDDLLIGMPVDAFDDGVLVTHLPPVGTVGRHDWSHGVDGIPFVPLAFPLVEGRTWQTSWGDDAVTATVRSVEGQTAHIDMVGATRHVSLLYDARIGALRQFAVAGYGSYEALDYGFDFVGEIAVPSQAAPVLEEARVQGLLDGDANPAAPVSTIQVDGAYDHISVLMMTGPSLERLPGAYRLEAVAPDGSAFVMTSAPPESGSLRWRIFHHDEVVGDWEVSWVVAGHGFGMVKGVAYDARHFLLGDERSVPLATQAPAAQP